MDNQSTEGQQNGAFVDNVASATQQGNLNGMTPVSGASSQNQFVNLKDGKSNKNKMVMILIVVISLLVVVVIGLLIAMNINGQKTENADITKSSTTSKGSSKIVSCVAVGTGWSLEADYAVDESKKQLTELAYEGVVTSSAGSSFEYSSDSGFSSGNSGSAVAMGVALLGQYVLKQYDGISGVSFRENEVEDESYSFKFSAKRTNSMNEGVEEMLTVFDGKTADEIKTYVEKNGLGRSSEDSVSLGNSSPDFAFECEVK